MSSHVFPTAAEVVVIGGGIAGVATAWHLHRLGVPVVLCEKGRIAGEQSSRNWGWIRKQGRDPAELPLIIESLQRWREIVTELDEDIGWHAGGVTYLIENDADAERYRLWLEHAQAHGLDSRLLSTRETADLFPGIQAGHQGAIYTASDARAEPARAVPAMARHLRRAGVPIFEDCAVRTVERSGGRVEAVVTEHGRIACTTAVVAGGAWSRRILDHLGFTLPQLHVISSVQRTDPAPLISESAIGGHDVAMRRRADGGYTLAKSGAARAEILPANIRHARAYLPVLRRDWRDLKFRIGKPFIDALLSQHGDGSTESPFERTRVLDPEPDHKLLDTTLATAKAWFPQLAGIHWAERWAGAIDVLPDEVPALGPVPGIDGLLVATGFSGHGFGIGPGAGLVTARLAAGESPGLDLGAFSPNRFARNADSHREEAGKRAGGH
jgi:glycine/D-amino acid oxidase-like deaminating enzyme